MILNPINCLFCGKENNNKKYCNLVCKRSYESKISKIHFDDKSCIICNKVFTPKSKSHIACSKPCWSKYYISINQTKPQTKACKQCNSEFKPYTSLDKFCSANCRVENVKSKRKSRWSEESVKKRMGQNNPAYKHGLRAHGLVPDSTGLRLFRSNRKEITENQFNKYGYNFCEDCKRSGVKLEGHHIVYRSEKPKHDKLHDKNNIILLCVPCHNKYHNIKSTRNELVTSRKLYLMFGNDILDK